MDRYIGSTNDPNRRKLTNHNGSIIDYDEKIMKNRLKESRFHIQMAGRPAGSTKDPNRRKVTNPNGRIIDYDGLQYNKLIRSGYKLNDAGTHLVEDGSFTGDIVKTFAGRPRGKASTVPDSQKIKNPETGRLIKKNAYTFKQLIKKYSYDETKNELITTVFDPKQKNNISLNSPEFKKRIIHGYIYDKLDNTLTKPSKKTEKVFKTGVFDVHDLTIVNKTDPIIQMNKLEKRVELLLYRALQKQNGIKFNIGFHVILTKPDTNNTDLMVTQDFHISEKMVAITHKDEINKAVLSMNEGIHRRIDRFTVGGSGWSVEEITRHFVSIAKYKPLAARSYIPLPGGIQNKKATINIQNEDNKCFMYCLGRILDPNPEKDHLERVFKHLKSVCRDLGLYDIEMPVSMKDIPTIEKKFNISINVFGHEGTDIFPIKLCKEKYDKHVDLLYTKNEETDHYVLITDFDKLNFKITKHNKKQHFCKYCIQHFTTEEILKKHMDNCIAINGVQAVELPKKGMKLEFSNLSKTISKPFVIYADIEALLIHIKNEKQNLNKSYTINTQKHEACSIGYKVVCSENNKLSKPFKMFRGRDAIPTFFKSLFQEEEEIIKHMKTFKKTDMIMTLAERGEYNLATKCYLCDDIFTEDNKKIRDHCHVSGKYRGAAHEKCNLQLKLSPEIPVIFHNLKGYDTHHLMLKLGECNKNIKVIPNNMEKYISFLIGTTSKEWDDKLHKMVDKERFNLKFIDSFGFMPSSLSKLVENLKSSGIDNFKYTHEEFGSSTDLITRKGIYPYSYMNKWSKFDVEPSKLKRKHFTNDLTGEKITKNDHKFFKKVCDEFNIKNLGEYHDLYLKSDVLLLADVFESFRKMCLKYYKLDPAHYYTAPGLAWDACLKMTGIELDLLSDVDMHQFIELGLRGGVSIITRRKGAANNKYMKDYNSEKPSKYLVDLDVNNLYGWAMSHSMPYSEFKWIDPDDFKLESYEKLCDNTLQKGYILEVYLKYPKELHDKHNEYPYCPEHGVVTPEMLSEYSNKIAQKHNIKCGGFTKLIPNLYCKEKYVIHERNLRQAVDAGLIIKKIHRVLEFNQKPWMRAYIDFNTEKRKEAKNEYEKDFFKLMNNSVFGKTMENVRKRINVKLITDEKKFIRYVSKPTFINGKIFNENLVAVHCTQEKIKLNKPVYVGLVSR